MILRLVSGQKNTGPIQLGELVLMGIRAIRNKRVFLCVLFLKLLPLNCAFMLMQF